MCPFGSLFGLTVGLLALVPFGGTVGVIIVTLTGGPEGYQLPSPC
jgi:predicted PurR-regulated permease PerM